MAKNWENSEARQKNDTHSHFQRKQCFYYYNLYIFLCSDTNFEKVRYFLETCYVYTHHKYYFYFIKYSIIVSLFMVPWWSYI